MKNPAKWMKKSVKVLQNLKSSYHPNQNLSLLNKHCRVSNFQSLILDSLHSTITMRTSIVIIVLGFALTTAITPRMAWIVPTKPMMLTDRIQSSELWSILKASKGHKSTKSKPKAKDTSCLKQVVLYSKYRFIRCLFNQAKKQKNN